MSHIVRRVYEVEVHGLYYDKVDHSLWDLNYDLGGPWADGQKVMDAKQLQDLWDLNNWPFGALLDAATRYADLGSNKPLYLVEYDMQGTDPKSKTTHRDWTCFNDIGDARVLLGPVEVTATERDVQID